MALNLLIVDDHPLVRSGICHELEERLDDANIVEAGSVAEAIDVLAATTIDVAVLDLRLNAESGLDIARHIVDNGLTAQCVVLTSYASPQNIVTSHETGCVVAFLEKSLDVEPLVAAIDAAANGLSSLTVASVRAAEAAIHRDGCYNPTDFTKRERSIAESVADGLSDSAIAEKLNLAGSTVRNNLTAIYRKLSVESRTQLAALVWATRGTDPSFSA